MYFVETNFQSQQDQWTIFGFEIKRKNYDLRLELFWGSNPDAGKLGHSHDRPF